MNLKFGTEKKGGLSRPSTASASVVVFLFLLFLMAATVMRETALSVKRAEGAPQSPQMRLRRAQDVSYVYVLPLDASLEPRYRAQQDYVLLLNGSYAHVRQIGDFVENEKAIAARNARRSIAFRIKPDPLLDKRYVDSLKARLDKALEADSQGTAVD